MSNQVSMSQTWQNSIDFSFSVSETEQIKAWERETGFPFIVRLQPLRLLSEKLYSMRNAPNNKNDLLTSTVYISFIVIGRGVVVHAENAGAARLACASITPVPSLYIEKTLKYVKGATFSK